jgi:hypothetical protein
MNPQRISITALAFAFALGIGAPALAVTNSVTSGEPVHLAYNTRLIPQYSAGEYDGTLRLTINANGIVSGTYIPSAGGPRVVTGGVNGDNIWLDFGFSGRMHVTGTIRNGHIVGYASRGMQQYKFVANVTAAN